MIVDYEPLPAVVGLGDALKPGAPRVFDDVPDNLCCNWELGGSAATDAAFRQAAHIARIKLINNRLVGTDSAFAAAFTPIRKGFHRYSR